MQERALAALRKARSSFASFSTGQKAVTISLVLAIVVGGFFFSQWAAKPVYGTLYSNLSGADGNAIVEQLTADGVPYQLTDGGGTIMVPQAQVYDLRLKMSGQGLPTQADGGGYSLLDKQGVTTSDFMQHVGYQRALEGELARTIKAIDGVTSASVHLAIPQKDVFADDAAKPTASVLVGTQPAKPLTNSQIKAVVNLVSSSIEGMSPADVTLADSSGQVLAAAGEQALTGAGSEREEQTQSFEQRMSGSLQQMLTQVLGPNKAVVKVTADLDYDQTETKSQRYVSDPALPPLSSTTKEETYTGGGTPTGGVLGPDNIQVPNGNAGNDYKSTTETRDNAVGLVTETRKTAPGKVRKLDVAVLVDGQAAAGVDTAEIQRIVSSAAGINAQRGDTIAVSAMPFDDSAATKAAADLAAAAKAEQDGRTMELVKVGALALGIGLLFLIAWLRGRKKRRRSQLSKAELEQLEAMQAELERVRLQAAIEAAEREALPAGTGETPAEPDSDRREELRDEISGLVDRQPEEVAQLLRGWLADRRS
ncbi:flagellar basal-body MS-ring/collar protein FliF [Planomonospora parontospora]|uniref:flagellar basal-body MS-ring/collar protein FliF n=1 Tax=Planomonospora parontospora TaxID=58119 RepID=UPI0016715537|nr:flagellar basal-body MS-ring/collar protein FliF [Planomonospora parontospora]GGL47435.1 flagellar M-ring protein [Planomonospora parontospora subsp. antibiotica]GII19866.1 flagellar M-ring protein [Planomonospora parontospora subsp. antibiotica]